MARSFHAFHKFTNPGAADLIFRCPVPRVYTQPSREVTRELGSVLMFRYLERIGPIHPQSSMTGWEANPCFLQTWKLRSRAVARLRCETALRDGLTHSQVQRRKPALRVVRQNRPWVQRATKRYPWDSNPRTRFCWSCFPLTVSAS